MRKGFSSTVRSAATSRPKALDALRQAAEVKQVWNGSRRFDIFAVNGATLTDLLDAVAMASGGILLAYNRSGGMNIAIYLEGDKQSYQVWDAEEFTAIAVVVSDMLENYAKDKFADVRKELESAVEPLEGTDV